MHLKKIQIICEKNCIVSKNISVYFNAWLMDLLNDESAEIFHQDKLKPYSISSFSNGNKINFIVNLLEETATDSIKNILINSDLEYIHLKSLEKKELKILSISEQDVPKSVLTEAFYNENSINKLDIIFLSPTGFRKDGENIFFPDIRLIFQSLMKKYNFIFEQSENIDVNLLNEICKSIKITSYNLKTEYYQIHRHNIPGFVGKIRIFIGGNQTLRGYIKMLLEFGRYSGIGIKTAMGMGYIVINQKNGGKLDG